MSSWARILGAVSLALILHGETETHRPPHSSPTDVTSLSSTPPPVATVEDTVESDIVVPLPISSTTEALDATVDVPSLINKFPGEDAVYLEWKIDYENVIGESANSGYDWNLVRTDHRRLVIINPEDEDFTTFTLRLPVNHVLEKVDLSIYSAGRAYRRFGIRDMKEARNSDGSATYKFAFPEVIKGSVITQTYVVRRLYCLRNAPLYYEIPLQFRVPCEKVAFQITHPIDWELGLKKLADGRAPAITISEDKKAKRRTISYQATDVAALHPESFSPFYKEVAAYAELQVERLYLNAPGWYPIRYKAPKDWNGLSDEFKQDVIEKEPLFTAHLKRQIDEITDGAKDDLEKLDTIVTWLQRNMRVSSYQEIKAAGLDRGNFAHNLDRRQGTVVQITGLAMSMLCKAGIDATYLLIHSAEEGHFDPGFYSHSQLDAPAVMAQVDGKTYVVFPYRENMPIDHVPEEYQGQTALAIDRKGKSSFIQLPLGSQSVNETYEHYHLKFEKDGRIQVVEEQTLQGSTAFSVRNELEGLSTSATEKALKRMITFSDGKVNLKKHEVTDLADYKKPLKLRLEYDIEGLVTITPEEVIFNTGGLFSPISRIKARETAIGRENPIRIYFDETSTKTISLDVPADWVTHTRLDDFRIENTFGTLSGHYNLEQTPLTAKLDLKLNKAMASREQYPELQALVGKRTRNSTQAIVFKVKH